MSLTQILSQVQLLRQDSGKRISSSVIDGMTRSVTTGTRTQLIRSRLNPNGAGFIRVPTNGPSSLLNGGRERQAIRKLMTLPTGVEGNFTHTLNTALLGGTSYPVLTAVLGTAAGVVSGGAGLLFTVATTAIDVSRTTQRVLARAGDELWQVEEIGKYRDSGWFSEGGMALMHISSFFLVDPHRAGSQVRSKGWLIHEERNMVTIV